MGQYFKPVILNDKKSEILLSVDTGCLKLTEQMFTDDENVIMFTNLLHDRYNGMPVIWSGDYADEWDFEKGESKASENYSDPMGALYELSKSKEEETKKRKSYRYFINLDRREYFDLKHVQPCCYYLWSNYELLIKHDNKQAFLKQCRSEYFEGMETKEIEKLMDKIANTPESYGEYYFATSTVHPLPLLTADGNGRGGGDYQERECADMVGTWKADHIFVTDRKRDIPGDYKEIYPNFMEEL